MAKVKEVKNDPNPWVDIPHDHIWLPANDGAEMVCGDCEKRVKTGEETNGKS